MQYGEPMGKSPTEIAKAAYGVVTQNVFPPIPVRSMDWCAWYDGAEECGQNGYGGTEREAVEDLLMNWPR